jgi:hypothetical protein
MQSLQGQDLNHEKVTFQDLTLEAHLSLSSGLLLRFRGDPFPPFPFFKGEHHFGQKFPGVK